MLSTQRNSQSQGFVKQRSVLSLRGAQIRIAAETDTELKKTHIMAAASIEVARINAKADDGAEAEAREASGE